MASTTPWKTIEDRISWMKSRKSNASEEEVMIKKIKKAKKKKVSPLDKIEKELAKLEKLHEKENEIVENITEIIDDEKFKDDDDSEWQ